MQATTTNEARVRATLERRRSGAAGTIQDRRTKRNRTRGSQKRRAIEVDSYQVALDVTEERIQLRELFARGGSGEPRLTANAVRSKSGAYVLNGEGQLKDFPIIPEDQVVALAHPPQQLAFGMCDERGAMAKRPQSLYEVQHLALAAPPSARRVYVEGEHRLTPSAQLPTPKSAGHDLSDWALGVGCWEFSEAPTASRTSGTPSTR
jgi:hypothetical protein